MSCSLGETPTYLFMEVSDGRGLIIMFNPLRNFCLLLINEYFNWVISFFIKLVYLTCTSLDIHRFTHAVNHLSQNLLKPFPSRINMNGVDAFEVASPTIGKDPESQTNKLMNKDTTFIRAMSVGVTIELTSERSRRLCQNLTTS